MTPYASGEGWTLYAGDCLDVLRKLEAGSVDAVVTDPPYSSGGRQQASARSVVSKNGVRDDAAWFLGDNMGTDSYLWFMREIGGACLPLCTPGAPAYVFTDWRQYTTITTAWESVGWTLRNVVVWDKARGGAMGSWWRNNHEWVPVFTRGAARPLSSHSFFNTWAGTKPQGGEHPTEKPVDLMRWLVSSITPDVARVLDPFAGSGTTGVAALLEGRRFVGVEREPAYLEIAARRLREAEEAAKQVGLFTPAAPAPDPRAGTRGRSGSAP